MTSKTLPPAATVDADAAPAPAPRKTVKKTAAAAETPPWAQGALTPERVFASPSLTGPAARGVG